MDFQSVLGHGRIGNPSYGFIAAPIFHPGPELLSRLAV
jgi:hypothetical protein